MRNDGLKCKLTGGRLVISIGIDTLAHAFVVGPVGDELTRNDDHALRVTDTDKFAAEVVRALTSEEEDGSSPLTNLFDTAFRDAINDGAEGVYWRDLDGS